MVGAGASAVKIGDKAPGFSLTDQSGKSVSLGDYSGKIVVLEWTNPECPFVQRHYEEKTMPTLAATYVPKGVVWLAINSGGDATTAIDKKWSDHNHLTYPVLDDASGRVGKSFGARSTPHLFIINTDGTLAYRGGIDNDPDGDKPVSSRVNYVQKALDELLAGKPVSIAETKSYGCGVDYKE